MLSRSFAFPFYKFAALSDAEREELNRAIRQHAAYDAQAAKGNMSEADKAKMRHNVDRIKAYKAKSKGETSHIPGWAKDPQGVPPGSSGHRPPPSSGSQHRPPPGPSWAHQERQEWARRAEEARRKSDEAQRRVNEARRKADEARRQVDEAYARARRRADQVYEDMRARNQARAQSNYTQPPRPAPGSYEGTKRLSREMKKYDKALRWGLAGGAVLGGLAAWHAMKTPGKRDERSDKGQKHQKHKFM